MFFGAVLFAIGCTVTVTDPLVDGSVAIQAITPSTIAGSYQRRISIRMDIANESNDPIFIDRVELNNKVVSKFAVRPVSPGGIVPTAPKGFIYQPIVRPDDLYTFQNCNCKGSLPLIIDSPAPPNVTVSVYFVGRALPVQTTVPMHVHKNNGGSYTFPAKTNNLKSKEYWGASSNHAGDGQAFALDMGVWGWDTTDPANPMWNGLYPGTDGSEASSSRTYGVPIHAMSDGEVCWAVDDQPEWDYVNQVEDYKNQTDGAIIRPISARFGKYFGGGNQIFVKTGNEVANYSHFQPGSIPTELLVTGATVKRGQYLGKVGYSGNSSGPHIHIHVNDDAKLDLAADRNGCDSKGLRPMAFDGMYSIPKDESAGNIIDGSLTPANWSHHVNHSVPDTYSLLYPSNNAPDFQPGTDDKQYIGIWKEADYIEYRVKVAGWDAFIQKKDELADDSFRLIEIETIEENGERQYIGIFKRGTEGHAFVGHSNWADFLASWNDLSNQGLRLVDMETYASGGLQHFVGVYLEGNDPYAIEYHPDWDSFTTGWKELYSNGLRLVDVDVISVPGSATQYIGVYRAGDDLSSLVSLTGLSEFNAEVLRQADKGYNLVDIESFGLGSSRQYIGVFHEDSTQTGYGFKESYDAFFKQSEEFGALGFRLVDVHVEN